ncbi:alanine dehydrogenase [Peijinzhouia sedimentorum]
MTEKSIKSSAIFTPSESYITQEKLLEVKPQKGKLTIGIPRETALQENRVALTPEGVKVLTLNGHRIVFETAAGLTAKFSDREYSEAGAHIVYSAKEALEADVVLKVEPPTIAEIEMMQHGSTLISAMQMGNLSADYLEGISKKKITAVAYELIQDKVGGMPLVRAMSEIAGSMSMLIASEYLSNVKSGQGIIVGGITGVPPTNVLIIGAGTVGEFAARTALGLGAEIRVFDNHLYKLRRIRHLLGQGISTSTIDSINLGKALREADIVVAALRAEKGRNRIVITEEMIASMKSGSIMIDVGIDQGGCVETSEITTHEKPVFVKHGVIHYCVPNIASRVARTATTVISNIFAPILLQAADNGGINEFIHTHKWFMKGIYMYKGTLTNEPLAQKFNMRFKDLSLLLAARY